MSVVTAKEPASPAPSVSSGNGSISTSFQRQGLFGLPDERRREEKEKLMNEEGVSGVEEGVSGVEAVFSDEHER